MEETTNKRNNKQMHNGLCVMLMCIPMCYSFWTRYKGKNGFFAWLVKYFIPVLTMGVLYSEYSFVGFVLGLFYVYSLYEIGYIQNDCETIKKESNPTLRIDEHCLEVYESNKYFIYFCRALYILLFGVLLIFHGVNPWIVVYGFLTLPVFFVYNYVRNRRSLFIHLLLLVFRYSVPVVAAVNGFCPLCLLFLFFTYPVTLFVERSVKGKFGYRNMFIVRYVMHDYSERYSFRIKYYLIFFVITVMGVVFSMLPYINILPVALLLTTSVISKRHENLHYEK